MGEVINFKKVKSAKKPKVLGHRISFYTDEEIDLTLMALNTYAWDKIKYNIDNMTRLDPLFIEMCLIKLINSGLMSVYAKQVIKNILNNVEEITEINYANEV